MQKSFVFVMALIFISACSSKPKSEGNRVIPPTEPQTLTAPAPAAPTSTSTPQSLPPASLEQPKAQEQKSSLNKAQAQAQAEAESMKAAVRKAVEKLEDSKHHGTRHAGPVPAEKALGWLKNGNRRFEKGYFRTDGASAKDRRSLASGQKPHSIILSCSDSRVPPEVVFDQKLGEVFVVRTAGQSLDENVIASLEYAIEHLGANLLVVMGHDSCGAVKATLQSLTGADLGTPALNALAADIKPRVQHHASKPLSQGLVDESWSNVSGVAKDVLERSALIRDLVTAGEVKIVKAMYRLESGQVDWQ